MTTFNSVYSGAVTNPNSDLNDRMWMAKQLLDSSGITTFFISTDGTASGTSLFQSIADIHITASSNSAAKPAFGTLTSVSDDLRQIIAQAFVLRTVGSGATVTSAPSGTTIYCQVIGQGY